MQRTQQRKSLVERISSWISATISVSYCSAMNSKTFECFHNPGYVCLHPEKFRECEDYIKGRQNPKEYRIQN